MPDVEPRGAVVDWATLMAGTPHTATKAIAQIDRNVLKSSVSFTGKPLCDKLLRNVSAL